MFKSQTTPNKECFYPKKSDNEHGRINGECWSPTCAVFNHYGIEKGWEFINKEANKSPKKLLAILSSKLK